MHTPQQSDHALCRRKTADTHVPTPIVIMRWMISSIDFELQEATAAAAAAATYASVMTHLREGELADNVRVVVTPGERSSAGRPLLSSSQFNLNSSADGLAPSRATNSRDLFRLRVTPFACVNLRDKRYTPRDFSSLTHDIGVFAHGVLLA